MKEKEKNIVKVSQLLSILKQTSLGGLLEECLLSIKKGKAKIEAVDITNSLIVICKKKIVDAKISVDLGLGNIDLLIKFLSTLDSSKDKLLLKLPKHTKSSATNFTLSKANSRRKLTYLLTNPELIATQLQTSDDKEDPYEKMKDIVEHKVEITPTFMKDFLSYVNLLKTKDVRLDFDGDEEVSFICGGENDHQFTLTLSTEVESDCDSEDGFELKINGDFLAKIFSVIDFDEDDPPVLSFAEDKLIMIENEGTAWAIVPLANIDEDS